MKAINPKYQNLVNRLLAAHAAYDAAIDFAQQNDRPEDNIWQHLLDRFQTNLDDWSGAEEEGV